MNRKGALRGMSSGTWRYAPVAAGAFLAPVVYRLAVKRLTLEQFGRLSRGDVAPVIASMTPDVHHYFPGDHALGGERSDKQTVERWFGRFVGLVPKIAFDVRTVGVSGWPWDTVVAVEWRAHAPLLGGYSYDNRGTHVIRLSWGRVTSFHAYMDSQRTAAALDHLAHHGVQEAGAAQIVS